MSSVIALSKVALLIFIYYCVHALYTGLLHPMPALGDSWDYHIPISQSILDGTFLTLPHPKIPQWYYPGSAEAINAVFLLLHIPLTISNVFAIVCLFFACWKLGTTFKLPFYSALLFSTTFVTLTAVVRWMNAVSIDMWIAVFFVLSLTLLEKPRKAISYFFLLGVTCGMLIGSKYTAGIFVFFLLLFYGKRLLSFLSISRIIAFLIPFSFLGLFWYIRNYFLVGNPFYPLEVLGFSGYPLFSVTILHAAVSYPLQMMDAFFSEYKLWSAVLLFAPAWIVYRVFLKKQPFQTVEKLFLLGIIFFLFFLQFPASTQPWIMVSSMRYSYAAFIPLFLGVFLLARTYKKEELLGYFAIANMIHVLSLPYYPKLIFIYFPLTLLSFYLINKFQKRLKISD